MTSPTGSSSSYSFLPYPQEYFFTHNLGALMSPHSSSHSSSSAIELPLLPPQSSIGFTPQMASLALMQQFGQHQAPPSPMMHHAHAHAHHSHHQRATLQQLPPSPVLQGQLGGSSPAGMGSANTNSTAGQGSAEMKMLRHILATMTKMQASIKEIGEKQGEMMDSLTCLESRVDRIDETLVSVTETMKTVAEKISAVETTVKNVHEHVESTAEDSKSIRARVDDSETQEGFEKRLVDLMDGALTKAVTHIIDEVKDIKNRVMETEKYVRADPFAGTWGARFQVPPYMAQRYRDPSILGEQEQKEVKV